ncbi:hypothetical protein QT381_03920 [Galbitalea sp. SE-J8]|uniref:hypothetical protein n=1 Tax=Galbitalea sp. SE-J8 TaxID=3054952 RepID=UPI00259CC9C9|nr:hypothetical protein [Galbitalea sp. SE-J8]MDM4762152.1 hypothetical protein [Galbitalea sp. SE-J8]
MVDVREGDPGVAFAHRCALCGSGDHGRPVVADGFVSLTRALGRVFVARSDRPVGVDAEPIAAGDERVRAIGRLTGVWSAEHWTRVEAVLKADGRGLAVDPGRVRVEGDRAELDGVRYRLRRHPFDAALVVTTAVRDDGTGTGLGAGRR